eukprot:10447544-Karenia_brevis.AAC.1
MALKPCMVIETLSSCLNVIVYLDANNKKFHGQFNFTNLLMVILWLLWCAPQFNIWLSKSSTQIAALEWTSIICQANLGTQRMHVFQAM